MCCNPSVDHQAAVVAFGNALDVLPDNVPLLNDRANSLHQLGRNAESMADAQRALTLDPGSIAAFVSLGNALHAMGRHDESLERVRPRN